MAIDRNVEVLIVDTLACNTPSFTKLDLFPFAHLRQLEVADCSFVYVKEVKMIGLKWLESVVIGAKCFTKEENEMRKSPTRHLYLKDCERLRELRIGNHSFENNFSWVIVNLPSLEEIEVGEWCEGNNYCSESALIVKSKRLIVRLMTRPIQLEIVVVP